MACVHDSLKCFFLGGGDIDEFHALPLGEIVCHVGSAANERYIKSHPGDSGEELLAMGFYATHHIGDSAGSCNDNLHISILKSRVWRQWLFCAFVALTFNVGVDDILTSTAAQSLARCG